MKGSLSVMFTVCWAWIKVESGMVRVCVSKRLLERNVETIIAQ